MTYLNPLVAVAFGVLVLGEPPGTGLIAGLVFILGGAWLATDGGLPTRAIRALRVPPRWTRVPVAERTGEA